MYSIWLGADVPAWPGAAASSAAIADRQYGRSGTPGFFCCILNVFPPAGQRGGTGFVPASDEETWGAFDAKAADAKAGIWGVVGQQPSNSSGLMDNWSRAIQMAAASSHMKSGKAI
jgi:hypothetical protein